MTGFFRNSVAGDRHSDACTPVSFSLVAAAVTSIILTLDGLVRGYAAFRLGCMAACSYIIFVIALILDTQFNIFGVLKGEIHVDGSRFIYPILSAVLPSPVR